MDALRAIKMDTIVKYQDWPSSVYVLLLTGFVVLLVQGLSRPGRPDRAPMLLKGGWPLVGMSRFFSDRLNFIRAGMAASKSGNFTFYYGPNQIVSLAGLDGRKTFFESKELNMAEGYAKLYTATPTPKTPKTSDPNSASTFTQWFNRALTRMMRVENLVKNLPLLVGDTKTRLEAIVARDGGSGTGIIAPFEDIYAIVYQLTVRTVGANEIAESPELLEKTLSQFEVIENNVSPLRVAFPWLPTVRYFRQIAAGGKLYMIFNKIFEDRKKTGRREEDPFQYLMDTGEDVTKILTFVVGSLFAGQLNSGINAAWLFTFLAADPEWYGRVRAEVDGVVARHRASALQTPAEVLASLTLDEFEGEFPLVDTSLRECIRLSMTGCAFRKNLGGRDIPIGKTGEVVPRDGFAVFLVDDVHMNPDIYTDPGKFDPGRFLPDRAEDKKEPLSFAGWGIARHPCLGMRFAKLEMGIISAVFVSMFDFSLCDTEGNPVSAPLPPVDRSRHSASKPEAPIRLRYKLREQWK